MSQMQSCDSETLDHCANLGGVDDKGLCPISKKPCHHHPKQTDWQDFGPDAQPEIELVHFPARERKAGWKLNRRWDRAARLFGEAGMEKLANAKVTIFGVGGVGSFTAEALARSGVGHLKLVDFDAVCATNVNRQLQAMKGTVGKSKVELMAERCRLINPDAEVTAVHAFYYPETSDELLADEPDFVVDAIDNISAKMHLLVTCKERGIALVSSMGAAGKIDPTLVRVADLSETFKDPLARDVRKYLRRNYGMNTAETTGIRTVFSPEERIGPFAPGYDAEEGFRCICPGGDNDFHSCDDRNQIDGTASFVTGTFGLAAASVAVRHLIGQGA